jgi:hypothetical protein
MGEALRTVNTVPAVSSEVGIFTWYSKEFHPSSKQHITLWENGEARSQLFLSSLS